MDTPKAKELLEKALGHIDQRECCEALRLLEQAAALEPKNATIWYNLGTLLLKEFKGYEETARAYRKALDIDGNRVETWRGLGVAYAELNQHREAAEAFKKALEIDGNNAETWYNLGIAYAELNQHEEAAEAFKKALDIDGNNVETWRNLGISYGNLNRYEKAVAAYRKALDIDGNYAVAWYNLGNAYTKLKRYGEAVEAYRKALEIDRDYAAAWYNLGASYAILKRYGEAAGTLKKGLEIDGNDANAWYNLGAVYHTLKRYGEAVEAYKKALEIDGNHHNHTATWNNLGNAYSELKRYGEAVEAYRKALEIDRDYAAAWYNLGRAYISLEQYGKAIEAFKKVLDIDRNHASVWAGLGIAYDGLERYEEVIEAYEKVLEIDGNDAIAWYNLGTTYSKLKRYEESLEAYKKALDIDENYATAWYNLGSTYKNLKRYGEAVEAYRKALDIDGNDAAAWNNLGNAYHKLNRYQEAIEACRKALDIDENYAIAWANLGASYDSLIRYEEAVEAFKKAIEIDENYAYPWGGLGAIYCNLKRYGEGIAAYKKVLEIDENYAEVWCNLGLVYFEIDRLNWSIDCFEQALIRRFDWLLCWKLYREALDLTNNPPSMRTEGQWSRYLPVLEQVRAITLGHRDEASFRDWLNALADGDADHPLEAQLFFLGLTEYRLPRTRRVRRIFYGLLQRFELESLLELGYRSGGKDRLFALFGELLPAGPLLYLLRLSAELPGPVSALDRYVCLLHRYSPEVFRKTAAHLSDHDKALFAVAAEERRFEAALRHDWEWANAIGLIDRAFEPPAVESRWLRRELLAPMATESDRILSVPPPKEKGNFQKQGSGPGGMAPQPELWRDSDRAQTFLWDHMHLFSSEAMEILADIWSQWHFSVAPAEGGEEPEESPSEWEESLKELESQWLELEQSKGLSHWSKSLQKRFAFADGRLPSETESRIAQNGGLFYPLFFRQSLHEWIPYIVRELYIVELILLLRALGKVHFHLLYLLLKKNRSLKSEKYQLTAMEEAKLIDQYGDDWASLIDTIVSKREDAEEGPETWRKIVAASFPYLWQGKPEEFLRHYAKAYEAYRLTELFRFPVVP